MPFDAIIDSFLLGSWAFTLSKMNNTLIPCLSNSRLARLLLVDLAESMVLILVVMSLLTCQCLLELRLLMNHLLLIR